MVLIDNELLNRTVHCRCTDISNPFGISCNSLLHLGIKDVHLGPSLPAFVTPNVLDVLVKNYNLTPIGTPEGDLKKILA